MGRDLPLLALCHANNPNRNVVEARDALILENVEVGVELNALAPQP